MYVGIKLVMNTWPNNLILNDRKETFDYISQKLSENYCKPFENIIVLTQNIDNGYGIPSLTRHILITMICNNYIENKIKYLFEDGCDFSHLIEFKRNEKSEYFNDVFFPRETKRKIYCMINKLCKEHGIRDLFRTIQTFVGKCFVYKYYTLTFRTSHSANRHSKYVLSELLKYASRYFKFYSTYNDHNSYIYHNGFQEVELIDKKKKKKKRKPQVNIRYSLY